MTYEQQVLQILTEVGERGISVGKLAKHVYNMNCTLFYQPDLQEIKQQVWRYLQRSIRPPQSLIERMERRGYYRLNMKGSAVARQLVLDFSKCDDEEQQPEEELPKPDLSLSLFD